MILWISVFGLLLHLLQDIEYIKSDFFEDHFGLQRNSRIVILQVFLKHHRSVTAQFQVMDSCFFGHHCLLQHRHSGVLVFVFFFETLSLGYSIVSGNGFLVFQSSSLVTAQIREVLVFVVFLKHYRSVTAQFQDNGFLVFRSSSLVRAQIQGISFRGFF